MVKFTVSSDREYEIFVGAAWQSELSAVLASHTKVLVVAPTSLKESLALDHIDVFYTPDGESQKDVRTLEEIWKVLGNIQLGRKDAIVAIGGGATTDLAGFAAATWLRGVEWYAFPTTLAAMVDASIGGKTGINTAAGKNLVGSFYSPARVVIDPVFLDTLSDRDFAAGLAEVIKTGLIADVKIIDLLEGCANLAAARAHSLELIERSARVKADVVSKDFKEGKLREILNFGHTFGHAVERSMNYQLRHGEAVSIGLIFALHLSELMCDLEPGVTERMNRLLTRFGLPVTPDSLRWDELLHLMRGDKKSRDGQLRFIGLSKISEPFWLENVPVASAQQVYERIAQ
jgi:3-dehydroquinate synthase